MIDNLDITCERVKLPTFRSSNKLCSQFYYYNYSENKGYVFKSKIFSGFGLISQRIGACGIKIIKK